MLLRSLITIPFFAISGLLVAPQSGQAQDYRAGAYYEPQSTASAARGQYGGGFIELLMTGRDPTPHGRGAAVYNQPPRGAYITHAPQTDLLPQADPLLQSVPPSGRLRQAGYAAPQALGSRPIKKVLDPRFEKQDVAYHGPHGPGTIVIDTPSKFLYLVQPGGRALRYGIGVGRPGFEWAGVKTITRKAEWPSWTPPTEMLKRRPDLPRFMAGGPDNPMGARAMYLGSSLYRIHGTNEPNTIGQAVSSGCIRMTNDDVTDLYERVRVGMKVIVI